jgi:predicted negative regulator of RcsB-dependent stress response
MTIVVYIRIKTFTMDETEEKDKLEQVRKWLGTDGGAHVGLFLFTLLLIFGTSITIG